MVVSRRRAVANEEAMATTVLSKLDPAFENTVEPIE